EEFVRVGDQGRIDVVTSSAQSRLGNPVTFAVQDETGIWTKQNKMVQVADTQRRGLAGMQGRSIETTNAFDPTQMSVAQMTYQSRAKDIFKFYRQPPKRLKYERKANRRKIQAYVYAGSLHVNLDSIEAEAAELIERGELAQAERFFGNRMSAGSGVWMDIDRWQARRRPREVPDGSPIVLGFDGYDVEDWTRFRAETGVVYQLMPTYRPLRLPTVWILEEWGGQV